MSRNDYEIVIKLPESDGILTTDDRHLAMAMRTHVQDLLAESGTAGCSVGIRRQEDQAGQEALQRAYQKLLDLHMGALLQHGPGVAAGLALAIGVIHDMLPDQALSATLAEWAERIGEQPHEECLSAGAAGECPHGATETAE